MTEDRGEIEPEEDATELIGARPRLPEARRDRVRAGLSAGIASRLGFLRGTRRRAVSYIGAGAVVVAIAAVGLAGIGPFAS